MKIDNIFRAQWLFGIREKLKALQSEARLDKYDRAGLEEETVMLRDRVYAALGEAISKVEAEIEKL